MIPKFRAWDKVFKEMVQVNALVLDEQVVKVTYKVKCTRGCHHEVYLEKEYGGTFIGGMPAIYLKGLLSGYAWTEDEEIIGNIYENPELLGVEE